MNASLPVRIERFFATWQKDRYALTGSINLHDLCWVARISSTVEPKQPLYAEILKYLITHWHKDGSLIRPSTLTYCNFATTIAFANTLLIWTNSENYNFTELIKSVLSYAAQQLTQIDSEFKRQTELYGSYFKFTGLAGKWLILACECELLINQGASYLEDSLKSAIGSYAKLRDKLYPPGFNFEKLLADNPLVFHFAEYFPETVLKLPIVYNHVNTATTLPGYNAAFSARYYQLTRHIKVKSTLDNITTRPQDGLLPNRRLTEIVFILYYLLKTDINVAEFANEQITYLLAELHPNGIGVEPGTAAVYPDCDTSAVAQYVCYALRLPLKMPTTRLNNWWDNKLKSYQSSDGRYSYTTSTLMHVLETYLIAPDVTLDEKYTLWDRTMTQLEQRSWEELHHISPFYIWEKIITVIFSYAEKFPLRQTQVHYQALALLLKFQDKITGGFYSHYLGYPTLEETALALLALKSVLATSLEQILKQEVQIAAIKAEEFLLKNIDNKNHPEFWVGKLLGTPTYLVEAIILASLSKPWS